MLGAVTLTLIAGVTICTSRADISAADESECRTELERQLREYVKLESWQKLFTRHLKFTVNDRGEILRGTKRLKFNTIIHNAIYGCDHEHDDEVDDCPNIYPGSIKSCRHGTAIMSAMFRAAMCVFVESSVKHLVLSDVLLDTYPANKLDVISAQADQPIRKFGETVVRMLSTLTRGQTAGLGELMALNLYLNNRYGTVFMHKVPVTSVASTVDYEVARRHARRVHDTILGKLRAYLTMWCGDRDMVTQYRLKYVGATHATVLHEMAKNTDDTDDLIRDLNVQLIGGPSDLDFSPKRIVLADYVDRLVSLRPMPDELLADIKSKTFEVSYEFDPPAVSEYHGHVFRAIYACFYWTTISHLRLAVRVVDELEKLDTPGQWARFAISFVKFIRALIIFNVNRSRFATALPPTASANLTELLSFFSRACAKSRNEPLDRVIRSSRPAIRTFADLLSADMETVTSLAANAPARYLDGADYATASKLMRSNYRSFARLVSATCGFGDDLTNAVKLKRLMPYMSDVVDLTTDA